MMYNNDWRYSQEFPDSGRWLVHKVGGNRPKKMFVFDEENAKKISEELNSLSSKLAAVNARIVEFTEKEEQFAEMKVKNATIELASIKQRKYVGQLDDKITGLYARLRIKIERAEAAEAQCAAMQCCGTCVNYIQTSYGCANEGDSLHREREDYCKEWKPLDEKFNIGTAILADNKLMQKALIEIACAKGPRIDCLQSVAKTALEGLQHGKRQTS